MSATGVRTPAWLGWTVTGADDSGFQQHLFLRLFQVRLLASALYLATLLTTPLAVLPTWAAALFVAITVAWQTGVYLAFRNRSPAVGGLFWLGFEAGMLTVSGVIGQNPLPLTLLLIFAPAGVAAVQYKMAGALVTWATGSVLYLVLVAPSVQPQPGLVVAFMLFSFLVGIGLGAATSIVDSERRAAVLARRDADRVQSELRAVLDASRDPMLVVEAGGAIRFASRAAREVFGEAATRPGRSVMDLPGLTLGPRQAGDVREARLVRDGGQQDFLVRVAPMEPSEAGGAPASLWMFRDVTAEREQARERVEFVSLVTHELRAPLTTVRAVVDLMLDPDVSGLSEERRDQMLRTLQVNAARWETLVSNLLTVSRIESETFRLHPTTVDLAEAARAGVERFGLDADVRGHHLEADLPAEPVLVRADPQWLAVIINNLISNALKYSPEGTTVTISVVDGPIPFLAVRDQGIGIAPEDQARLFMRFFRVNSEATREIQGTGLGLAICQRLAQLHGGRITVESTLGRGSTFRLELPAAADAGGGPDDGAEPGQQVS